MKMKKNLMPLLWSIALCGTCIATSCSDENENSILPGPDPVPAPALSIGGGSEVMQLDTLTLTASLEHTTATNYIWTMDGEALPGDSLCRICLNQTGNYTVSLTAVAEDGTELKAQATINVTPRFAQGVFVLNEGNVSDGTGTLTFIDQRGILTDSAYYRVNGSLLGNVCQDLFIADGRMYILSQNGAVNGGEGLLSIAQADNLEKIQVYDDPSGTLSWPSNVAAIGNDIYVRDNAGVYLLHLDDNSLTYVEGTSGAKEARMAVAGGKLFVMQNRAIQVIENGAVTHEIALPGTASGVAKAYDGNLWASCATPAKIIKIDAADYTMEEHDIDQGGLSMGWGLAPAFAAVQDTLYFSNAGFSLYRHIFSQNVTEAVADITQFLPDAGIYYNSLGANPANGQVIFATMKGYGEAYKTNDTALFDFSQNPPLISDFKGANSFPAGVFATAAF